MGCLRRPRARTFTSKSTLGPQPSVQVNSYMALRAWSLRSVHRISIIPLRALIVLTLYCILDAHLQRSLFVTTGWRRIRLQRGLFLHDGTSSRHQRCWTEPSSRILHLHFTSLFNRRRNCLEFERFQVFFAVVMHNCTLEVDNYLYTTPYPSYILRVAR